METKERPNTSPGWGFALLNHSGSVVRARTGYPTRRRAILAGYRFADRQRMGHYTMYLLNQDGDLDHEPVRIVSERGFVR